MHEALRVTGCSMAAHRSGQGPRAFTSAFMDNGAGSSAPSGWAHPHAALAALKLEVEREQVRT